MSRYLGALPFVLVAQATAHAQVASNAAPAFEVASVKRNVSGKVGATIRVPPAGELSFINVPLRVLIRNAYQLDAYIERYTLLAGPHERLVGSSVTSRADTPRFDVRAKPPANTGPRDRFAMMRALLEDRFKLRVHRDVRQVPTYALTVERAGRLGPNLVPSRFDCQAFFDQRRFGPSPPEPVDATGRSWCRALIDHSQPGVEVRRNAGPLTLIRQLVQPYVDRPIVDATGLSGNFEWVLNYSWGPDAPADVPSITTALREQLGLRLEARQGPIEVLVVDSVELPTPD